MDSFEIETLGKALLPNPIRMPSDMYTDDDEKVIGKMSLSSLQEGFERGLLPECFEAAGPRRWVYFDPAKTKVAIVTCGGLCPGINAVIRALCFMLWERYGVKTIYGVPHGYKGLAKGETLGLITPKRIEEIHKFGGTILGTSRGSPPSEDMLTTLLAYGIDVLFAIGGDGTMKGAHELTKTIKKKGRQLSVIGIPKTIDNDIPYVRNSFGFETAVEEAESILTGAHEEARSHKNGVGLVKLMGRNAGYIAANATLSAGHVNFCLIPEIPFQLDGPTGLFEKLSRRFKKAGHALIVVAEGAGQEYFNDNKNEVDASGNPKLHDIGLFLKNRITEHFSKKKIPMTLKYMEPSYIIRSLPANTSDRIFCLRFAQNAAHAAMSGKTSMLVGYWHGVMTHVPMRALVGKVKRIDPKGSLYRNILDITE